MSWYLRCPASSAEPELGNATKVGLATELASHVAMTHPAFAWPDWYVHTNCHSAPWHVPCPVCHEPLGAATDLLLITLLITHLKSVHPTFAWASWYTTENCHS